MGRAGVGRAYTHPFRIEPERGKRTEDGVKPRPSSNESCDVLKHDDTGS